MHCECSVNISRSLIKLIVKVTLAVVSCSIAYWCEWFNEGSIIIAIKVLRNGGKKIFMSSFGCEQMQIET